MSSSDDIVDNQGICLHFIPKDKNFLCLVNQRPAVIQRCTENEVCWIFCSFAWTISEVQFAGVKEVVRFFFEGHSHAIASACHTCARVWNQNKEFLKKLIEADSSVLGGWKSLIFHSYVQFSKVCNFQSHTDSWLRKTRLHKLLGPARSFILTSELDETETNIFCDSSTYEKFFFSFFNGLR